MNALDPFASATSQLATLSSGAISSVELVTELLVRMEHLNPAVNAIVTVNPELSLSLARHADAERSRGSTVPLLGLPVTIKDAIDLAGWPSTNGIPDNAERVPSQSAPAAEAKRRGRAP